MVIPTWIRSMLERCSLCDGTGILKAESVRLAEDRGTFSLPSLLLHARFVTGQGTLKQGPAKPAEEADGLFSERKQVMISNSLFCSFFVLINNPE